MNCEKEREINSLHATKAQIEAKIFEIDRFVNELKQSKIKLLNSRKEVLNQLAEKLLGKQLKQEQIQIE